MDRLSALIAIAALVALGACDKGSNQDPPASRTNAAKVATKKTDVAAFCDKQPNARFAAPALAAGALEPAKKWRWINVWATYCKPCIEEMPRLVKWQTKMGFDLQFISVDEEAEDIAAYRKLHPETPETKQLKPDTQGAWFTQLGLDGAAPIPVHVFIDAENVVRCVRAGGVREQDLPAVEALFAGK